MKLLALVQKNVSINIKDNYNEALKYMVDHGAPFNLAYKEVSTRIKEFPAYNFSGHDVAFLNYSPELEKRHDCYTNPHSKDVTTGIIPCGKAEDGRWLSHAIAHELLHAMAWQLEMKFGIKTRVHQILDTYYHNDDWNYPNGNFDQAWKELRPYMKLLFPLYAPTSPVETNSLSKWGLLPSIETKAALLLLNAKKAGFNIKITHGYRDPAYQDKLYAQGRTLPGKIVTNATGKTSKHCLGKAFDIAFIGKTPYPANANWKAIGQIGKDLGLKWGGDFKSIVDKVHFEL